MHLCLIIYDRLGKLWWEWLAATIIGKRPTKGIAVENRSHTPTTQLLKIQHQVSSIQHHSGKNDAPVSIPQKALLRFMQR